MTPSTGPDGVPGDRAIDPGDADYVPVEGLDPKSIELARAIEARAAAKVASDYEHIVWAYGLSWSLFVAYGIYLWRRSVRLRADLDALARRVSVSKR
jgi:hypothetical protein